MYSSNASLTRWHGRVALVTGASSDGIGAAVCAALVRAGLRVIGCARSHERIQALAQKLKDEGCQGQLFAKHCDLTQESDILQLFQQVSSEFGGVDILVNNAGLAYASSLLTGTTEQWDSMWQVNVRAPCICTREFFKSLKQRSVDDGHVIHIGSMSGHRIVGTGAAFYSATKFALRALAEGHRREARAQVLDNAKIGRTRVTLISPGLVETEFKERMSSAEEAKQLYSSLETLKPEDIADAVMYAISAPAHVDVHDILMRSAEQLM